MPQDELDSYSVPAVYVSKMPMFGLSDDPDVRVLQTRLNYFNPVKVGVDGNFGPGTREAVKSFQMRHNLGDDGVAGKATLAALGISIRTPAPDTHSSSAPWMDWMRKHLGEMEITGTKPTAFDQEIFSHTDFGHLRVMEAGCAATACTALEEMGYRSPHSADAASFDHYGQACELQPGCIVTWKWASGERHVSFCDGILPNGDVQSLGGNQTHRLCEENYERRWVHATRWPVK